MAEEFEEAPVGLVDETPSPESTSGGDEFAADMWPDTSEGDSDQASDSTSTALAPSDAQTFDPSKVNLARTSEEEVPEEYRPMFNEMQSQFKGLQTTLNERNQAFAELQVQQEQAAQQQAAPQSNNNSQPTSHGNPYPFLEERINQALNNGSITHEQAAASRAEMLDGAEQVEKIVGHLFTPYLPYLNVLPQMADVLGGMIQTHQANQYAEHESAYGEAQAVYGQGQVDSWRPMIEKLVGDVNPVTGQHFTVDTATRHLLGITAEQAEELRAKHKAAVNGARSKVGRVAPNAAGPTPAPRHLSEEQAAARMRAAGFE